MPAKVLALVGGAVVAVVVGVALGSLLHTWRWWRIERRELAVVCE